MTTLRLSPACRLPLLVAITALAGASAAPAQTPIEKANTPAAANRAAKTANAKATLPPEVEEKLQRYMKTLTNGRREQFLRVLHKEVKQIAKVTSLDAAEAKKLEQAAASVAQGTAETVTAKIELFWREQWKTQPSGVTNAIDQTPDPDDSEASAEQEGELFAHPVWKAALASVLTGDKAAAWNKELARRDEVLAGEFKKTMKASIDRYRDHVLNSIKTQIEEIKSLVSLSPERVKRLEEFARAESDRGAEAWRLGAEKWAAALSPEARQSIVRQGAFDYGHPESGATESDWQAGLAKLLEPAEAELLADARNGREKRRARVFARVLIALHDERVGLTSRQREQLEPIATRLALEDPGISAQSASDAHMSYSAENFLTIARKARREELAAILDPVQQKRWNEREAEQRYGRTERAVANRAAAASDKSAKQPAREPEPEFLEASLSDYLYDKAEAQRQAIAARMLLLAEDAARVLSLPAASAARLRTAAQGAAEERLDTWKVSHEQNARMQLGGARNANIRQHLVALPDYLFRQGEDKRPEESKIWQRALEIELDQAQRAKWKEEVDAREAYAAEAISGFILAEFDRRWSLRADQWKKLQPLFVKFVQEYSPDIERMFSSNAFSDWYMQPYSMFIPFAAIPEAELKAILGEQQWNRWARSEDTGNVASYWDGIQQTHKRRVKEARK